jgi:trigger factor
MYTTKKLDNSQIELTITVKPEDYDKDMKNAAVRVSQKAKIKGFRPGKAPYDVIKRELGEMAIMQEAIEHIVRHAYHSAVVAEKMPIIGQPEINLEKFAPGNDIVFKAIVALLPKVTVFDAKKVKVKKEIKKISDKDLDETFTALRGMQATEILKTGKAGDKDKLIIDMDMLVDKVPVDGGQAKDYQVYLSEPHYIKGFNEKLIGAKKDDVVEFELDFPKDHYQKHLAGKKVAFKITVKEVYERKLPELDEEFAKKLGQKSVEELKALVRKNREAEETRRGEQKAEVEMLDKMIEGSTFEEIPEVLVDSEKQKMFHELKSDLTKNNITMEQYLADLKKDEKQLVEDFRIGAEKRAKAALLSRQIALDEDIKVEDKELKEEIAKLNEMYKDNNEALENIKRTEVIETIATTLQNKKVMDHLRSIVFKVEKKK